MRWKKRSKILKMLWNKLYKNDGNIVSVLRKILQVKIPSVRRTKQNWLMLASDCAICGKKNWSSLKIKNFWTLFNSIQQF